MATPDEIRRRLEEQASQRVNPLLKGLSMLTGGIAGEFTGTNEQIRQQRQAKRALTEENLAALQEERMMERMKATRAEMMKEDLARLGEQYKQIGQRDVAQIEAKRPEMEGYLRSRSGVGGRTYNLGQPDIGTLTEMYSFEKGKEGQQQEAAKKKAGYTQVNVPGYGTIAGTPDQISELSKTIPQLKSFLEQVPSEEPPYEVTYRTDELTGQMQPTVRFKKPVSIAEQQKILKQLFANPEQGFDSAIPSAGVSKKEDQPEQTDIPGFKVRRK
jgi:hypothetical protein